LLRDVAARGRHPALITFGEGAGASWDSETVADQALRLARGLRDAGFGSGVRVAIWGPNSPVWIVAALAVLAAGGVLVSIDDLADAEQFDAALTSSAARLIFTTAGHLEASSDILRAHAARAILVDETECTVQTATGWQSLLGPRNGDLPVPARDEPALLSWTSGTTGSPKAFLLTHLNIASNVEAVGQLAVVGPRDHALLPLPLHHAYPFIVGTLSTLTLVTTIIGVPRLYEALGAAIDARVKARNLTVRVAWRALLKLALVVQQSTRLR